MYLLAKKHGANFKHSPAKAKKAYAAMVKASGLKMDDLPEGSVELSVDVGYWRKANHIHAWFVKNCQDDKDDCKEYCVSEALLGDLRAACLDVLDEKDYSLLPTRGGFFFGSTDYGDAYVNDLKDTVKQLDAVLDNPKFKGWNFYYQSSW